MSFCFGKLRFHFRISRFHFRRALGSGISSFSFGTRYSFRIQRSRSRKWFLFQNAVRTLRFRWALCGTIQFSAIVEILRLLIFDNKIEWWTTSNAFEKSIGLNKQRIDELFSNIRVEWWIKSTMAQQVVPVGRKTYWSLSNSIGKAGLNHCWTKIFSASLDTTEVTE